MRKHKTANMLLAVCPDCGKRTLHPRASYDPKKAVWCHLKCDDCDGGGNKDYNITYYGEFGWIEYNGKGWNQPLLQLYRKSQR